MGCGSSTPHEKECKTSQQAGEADNSIGLSNAIEGDNSQQAGEADNSIGLSNAIEGDNAEGKWSQIPPDMQQWQSYDRGSLGCGPGSYYGDGITVRISGSLELNSPGTAWTKIRELTTQDAKNLPVMWQMERPGHMIVHLQAFLRQNRDADTGKPLTALNKWAMCGGGDLPLGGSPIFYNPTYDVKLDSVDWSKIPTDMKGWRSHGHGSLGCGPGSYYGDGITVRISGGSELNSPGAAWTKIQELTAQDGKNPPVMWQMERPGHMIVHLQAFLNQNRDADTGKPLTALNEWAMLTHGGGDLPVGGSPVFFNTTLQIYKDLDNNANDLF